ncbi:MAG TPA: (5-formylfuran-3-yl)methyl phosphate synthase [Gemmataceae bacterium]|nr:(5-formylfuran-3-yl)methyl phosphate synthase [Gemmataceae bacterium]
MTQLLVSVRSVAEARQALAGGAALIDVKEPAHGSLGRADDEVIRAVVTEVAGRCPVSAALGEWEDGRNQIPEAGLTYVKWGLAGCGRSSSWQRDLAAMLELHRSPRVVLAAYADWECAQAPPVEEVFALARRFPGSVLLVDTHCKEANNVVRKKRPTLLDWLPLAWIEDLCGWCREVQVKIALAGSLGFDEIDALGVARPDWFAVRGAVCDGNRNGTIESAKVYELAKRIAKSSHSHPPRT